MNYLKKLILPALLLALFIVGHAHGDGIISIGGSGGGGTGAQLTGPGILTTQSMGTVAALSCNNITGIGYAGVVNGTACIVGNPNYANITWSAYGSATGSITLQACNNSNAAQAIITYAYPIRCFQ